jgi:hypothetical protein
MDCNTSKARRLPCSKNWLHFCQKTFGPQHIKGQKAIMAKKPAPRLPPLYHNTLKARRLPCPNNRLQEDLWTTTYQRPESYHSQKTGSTSAIFGPQHIRRPLDCNTSKARRLPYPKNRLHVYQKSFGPQHIKGQKATMPKKPAPLRQKNFGL